MKPATLPPSALRGDQVNHLNSGLMIVSCIAAYVYPVELFLLSYAVLGPLHYFTEISWLHQRGYFTAPPGPPETAGRPHRGWFVLVAVTTAVLIAGFAAEMLQMPYDPKWEVTLVYVVFVAALLVTEVIRPRSRAWVAGLALLLLLPLTMSRYYVVIAFLLVTIVHVFVFTGAFILHGALRSRSAPAMLSLLVFVVCAATFFVFVPPGHDAGDFARNIYRSFNALNAELIKLFRMGEGTTSAEIYQSTQGLTILRFIAFAYTYHYLNWFSKTSIIRWHQVSLARLAAIVAAWAGTIALYAHDYDLGMSLLYVFSMLHVLLEFPLNHRTFAGIARELKVRMTPAS